MEEERAVDKAARILSQYVSARNDWWRIYHIALAEARAKPKQASVWSYVARYAKYRAETLLTQEEAALVDLGIELQKLEHNTGGVPWLVIGT